MFLKMPKISLFRDELEELIEDEVVFSVRSVADQQCFYRYYDPATGRYLTSDPIGLNAGINTFGYVYQNPVNYYDPNGKVAVPVLSLAIGAFVGVISSGFTGNGFTFKGVLRGLFTGAASGALAGFGGGSIILGKGLGAALRGPVKGGYFSATIGAIVGIVGSNFITIGSAIASETDGGQCEP